MHRLTIYRSPRGSFMLPTALLFFSIIMAFPHAVTCQMESTVNSLADDAFAHPYDDPETMEDESVDGLCNDEMGRCTLRAALEEAAYMDVPAHVTFSVTGNLTVDPMEGGFYPTDNSLIQDFGQKVTIFGDGMNIPVLFAINNGTLISGLQFTNGFIGIEVAGTHNRVGLNHPQEANYISDMAQNGILVTGDSNVVTGNIIGLDLLGMPESNQFGIFVTGSENVIGGLNDGEGNVISGNAKGIGIYNYEVPGNNYVLGNFIGTDITGTQARGNQVGLDIIGPNVHIGTPDAPRKNVISGNTQSGILLGVEATSIFIADNLIGTDVTGTVPIPNRDGITLGPGSDGCIVQDNMITGNTQTGILISGLPDSALASENHLILGNTISANGTAGIIISGMANNNIIGSSLQDEYAPNIVRDNGQAGVLIGAGFGTPERNTIRENHFQDNNSFGIRILNGQAGIQPPMLTSYTDDGQGTSLIVGTHALAGATIDIYSGIPNQSLRPEGAEWLGSGQCDGSGHFAIQISSCPCDSVVATATDVLGNTSEFSSGWAPMTSSVRNISKTHALLAHPNPSNGTITFDFELDAPSHVRLDAYDLAGHQISIIANGQYVAGNHSIRWDADDARSGAYLCTLTTDSGVIRTIVIREK